MFDFSENIWYNHTVITNKGRCDMKPLSKSQQKIFDYLKECAGEGRVPSVREICEETGLSSTSTVHHHLKALEEKGLISREHGVNRCIQINGMEKTPIFLFWAELRQVIRFLPLRILNVMCLFPTA